MTFTEHLAELRTRIIRSMVALLIGAVLCYAASDYILQLLTAPLTVLSKIGLAKFMLDTGGTTSTAADQLSTLYVFSPLEPVMLKMKVAAYGGLLLVFPYVLYQAAAFIFPGLKPGERRVVKLLLFGGGGLAVTGVMIAYFLVLPFVLRYFSTWIPSTWHMQLRATETITVIIVLLAGFAIAFQYPLVVLTLVYMDLLAPKTLRQYQKPAIIGLMIVAAFLSPPDPFSFLFLLGPLAVLYEITIWLAYAMAGKRKRAEEAAAQESS